MTLYDFRQIFVGVMDKIYLKDSADEELVVTNNMDNSDFFEYNDYEINSIDCYEHQGDIILEITLDL